MFANERIHGGSARGMKGGREGGALVSGIRMMARLLNRGFTECSSAVEQRIGA